MEYHGYHFIHRGRGKVGSELCHHVIALTIGIGLTEKRGHCVKIEEIQFAMITLSS